MQVKILGPGCRNCQALEARVRGALARLAIDVPVEEVRDVAEIAGYGVMRTPGLAVDGEVLVSGRVPTERALYDLLAERVAAEQREVDGGS